MIELTIGCGDYDRTRALRDGRVQPEGIRLNYEAMGPEELFYRQLRGEPFDVSEFSLANQLILTSRGESPFVAVPVFPSRFFRHAMVYVNAGAGIEQPADLRGKLMGVTEYHMTATVFIRGFLWHDYGLRPEEMRWCTGGQNRPGGHRSRLDLTPPPGVRLDPIPDDRSLSDMLATGEIDAMMAAYDPDCIARHDPRVRRLFPDFAAVERDYHRRTGIFPIMHCLGIRRDIHRRHPWVARSLFHAFSQAKRLCLEELHVTNALAVTLPWLVAHLEETRAVLGDDPWPYGFEPNRATLEAAAAYCHEQGLLQRAVAAEEIFVPETLDLR